MTHPLRLRLALVGMPLLALACSSSEPAPSDDPALDDGSGGGTVGAGSGGPEDTGPGSSTSEGAASRSGSEGGDGTGDAGGVELTYWTHIKPLLDGRCATCHEDGGIAPFPLATYADAVEFAPAAVPAVQARTMPPWPPAGDCAEIVGELRLTADQIDMFVQWVDAGMPEGDPAEEGPPLGPVAPGLPRVDVSLQIQEPYVPTQSPDDYRCFVVPWTQQATRFVTGFRAVPGNAAIVHHVIAFLAAESEVDAYLELDAADPGPGYTCFGGTGGPSRSWLGAWAPGSQGHVLAEGLGLRVDPGSAIVLQVHYNALDPDVEPDATTLELMLDDTVEREAMVMPFANPIWPVGGMRIPAGDPEVVHEFTAPVGAFASTGFDVYASALHMHLLGRSGRLSVVREDGSEECLLRIDDWDFSWQGSYAYPQAHRVGPDDLLRLRCTFDNSVGNQPTIDGSPQEPRDVEWGEGTTDEMCLGIFLVAAP